MTDEESKKLRAYYHSLLEQQHVLEGLASKSSHVEAPSIRILGEEIKRVEADFPGLLPVFNANDYFNDRSESGEIYYKLVGVRSYVGTAIGRLKVAIEEVKDSPITQRREFSFIKERELRKILERDYVEIQTAYVAKCWKSVIILSGSAIEAILTDILLQNTTLAMGAKCSPKEPDITRWDLADLINVAVELKLVSAGVEKLSHSVRAYRNLIHPGNEIRNKLTFDAEEAKIALEVLHIVHRDLSL
jgi:hypothetical protein